jgi:hypothetical protein
MDFVEINRTNLKCSLIVASQEQISTDLGGEAVILNLKTGVYHGLNPVGTRIWNLLAEPRTVNDILGALLQEYEVEPDSCERDLLALLQNLADSKLIEIRNATAA